MAKNGKKDNLAIGTMVDIRNRYTQCFVRTFHKYGFDKDLKSHRSRTRCIRNETRHNYKGFDTNRRSKKWGGRRFFSVLSLDYIYVSGSGE